MIRELDSVVLTHDIPDHCLLAGEIGAAVHHCTDGAAVEVEFIDAEGKTVALLTLTANDV